MPGDFSQGGTGQLTGGFWWSRRSGCRSAGGVEMFRRRCCSDARAWRSEGWQMVSSHFQVGDSRNAYLIPTPPAMKSTFLVSPRLIPDGGQTKLPPMRMLSSCPWISSLGLQSHALAGLDGACWTASSTYGALPRGSIGGRPVSSSMGDSTGGPGEGSTCASAGVEVML